jgi:two-component system, chemotaxis family, protein-glutamate methylesterase/glutaminase
MAQCEIIVIGASLGALRPLESIVGGLSPDLPAAVFIVQHLSPTSKSHLPQLLGRHTPLPVSHARHGDRIAPGRIYVAMPNHHLTLEADRVTVAFGPRINGSRPAIDPLFYSAAHHFGRRVVGVILSGLLDDGVAGLLAIQRAGGLAIVQDPEDAEASEMPLRAIRYLEADYVLPSGKIGARLSSLSKRGDQEKGSIAMANSTVTRTTEAGDEDEPRARLSGDDGVLQFSCPDCGGAMQQSAEPGPLRYECHIGHRRTGESLLAEQLEVVEKSIWYTTRTLKEIVVLSSHLADEARQNGDTRAAMTFDTRARLAERHLEKLQQDLRGLLSEQSGKVAS